MRFGARLAGSKFALFSGFGATSWTPTRQRLFLFRSHHWMMRDGAAINWSIVTRRLRGEENPQNRDGSLVTAS
jgi:hypothetical protein